MNLLSRFASRWAIVAIVALAASSAWGQTTFRINSLSDNANQTSGDGSCNTGEWDGFIAECTLRAAIEEANATAGQVIIEVSSEISSNADGLSYITIESPLPFISNQITIAGETHPDFVEGENYTRLIILGATNIASGSGMFFTTSASGSVVRHIAIGGFNGNGITLGGGTGYFIHNNTVGMNWNSNSVFGFGNASAGIMVATNSVADSVILDNIVGYNDGHGITISASSSNVLLAGNVVGLRPPLISESTFVANADVANGGDGIHVTPGADNNIIGDSFFGGNTVSNNAGTGINIRSDNNFIRANRIGISHPDGVAPDLSESDYGNGGDGLALEGSGNVVGGADFPNIIGNAAASGIRIGAVGTTSVAGNNNVIDVNFIGMDSAGVDIGQIEGIRIDNGSNNQIQDATIAFNSRGIDLRPDSSSSAILRNTILDNSTGVWFRSSGTLGTSSFSDANVIGDGTRGVQVSAGAGSVVMRSNYIGTDANGTDLGNTIGIQINGSNFVDIGLPNAGNVIGYSIINAILLSNDAAGTSVQSNYIGIHPNGTPIGNGRGIRVSGESNSNRIGSSRTASLHPDQWQPGTDAGNIIAYSNNAGIDLTPGNEQATSNVIRGNRFFANNGTAIDLGMTELDVGGGASGPNEQMNFPDFDAGNTQFDFDSGTLNYRYRVQTTPANADYPLIIDFYLAEGESAEGLTFVGSESYPDTSAFEFVTGSLSIAPGAASGGYLIATATDSSGNTSQFSLDPVFLGTLPDSIFQDRFESE